MVLWTILLPRIQGICHSWCSIHKTNLDSVFLGCKYRISFMKESVGNSAIVNVASCSGIVAVSSLAA